MKIGSNGDLTMNEEAKDFPGTVNARDQGFFNIGCPAWTSGEADH